MTSEFSCQLVIAGAKPASQAQRGIGLPNASHTLARG